MWGSFVYAIKRQASCQPKDMGQRAHHSMIVACTMWMSLGGMPIVNLRTGIRRAFVFMGIMNRGGSMPTGTFENGVVFSITQGFIYGQEAAQPRISSGLEIIGTRGVAVMHHDFATVKIDLHGVTQTISEEMPYGDKKLPIMAQRLATAIHGGPANYPKARDSVVASRISWAMLDQARGSAPLFGTSDDITRILRNKHKQG